MTQLMLESGSLQLNDPDFWTFNGYVAGYTISVSLLFLFIATGQISFASDNRSTRVRYMLAIIQLLICASMSHLALATFDAPARVVAQVHLQRPLPTNCWKSRRCFSLLALFTGPSWGPFSR